MRAGYLDMKTDDFSGALRWRIVGHLSWETAMSESAAGHRTGNVIDLDVYRAVRTIQRRRAAVRRPVGWATIPQAYAWAPWLGTVAVVPVPLARLGRRSSG
jgi:hypothetical protein